MPPSFPHSAQAMHPTLSRRLVASGAVTAGAVALWNLLTGRRVRPLLPAIEGEQLTFEWRGRRIAYTRVGAGSPVILIHGIHAAASSHEWRHVAADLAMRHTVYALDLLGFGRSDRPAMRYTAALYVSLLDDFARRVVVEPAALVATSLSAAYAIALAARDAARFRALVLVAPTGLTRLDSPGQGGASVMRRLLSIPLLGGSVWNALVARPTLRRVLHASYADKARVTDDLVEAHWQATHQRGARHAPAAFAGHLLDLDVREPFRRLTQPTLILWGEQAVTIPVDEVRPFMASRPDFGYVILDPAGDLPHDERPADFVRLVSEFLARVGHAPRPAEGTGTEPRLVA